MTPLEILRTAPTRAREFQELLGGRAQAATRLRRLGRKLPMLAKGLALTQKSNKQEPLAIGTYIARNAKQWPNRTALLFEDRRYTHKEFDDHANRWANALAARGIKKGDAVAMFVDNRPELLFAVAGTVKLGAIAAMINSRQHGRALEHSLRVSKAKLVVVGEELWEAFAEVQGATDAPVVWLADRGGPAPITDIAAELTSTAPPHADVRLGDPCFYIYTSGTTGLPKASIMSHFRWVKGGGAFGIAALELGPDDVMYVPLPLYHSNALVVAWASAAMSGAALALRRKFSVTHFWDDVRKYSATAFIYIGELCRYLMNNPPSPRDRDHRVRKIVGNGLRPDIWKQFKARFGIEEVYEFYSASEANLAFVNLMNLDCTIGFCPVEYALVRYDIDKDEAVRGADGRLVRVARGEVGLLLARVSKKYPFDGYTDPKASEKKLLRDVFAPGDCWFNSGDLLRDQGFRHAQFVDRVGDTFRWKGENVSTNEVAEVMNAFDGVAETTVYGVKVPGTDGRAGMAAVVARVPVDKLDFAALSRYLRAELPAYAVPLFLRFQDALETTGTFKQVKGELRTQGFDPGAVAEPLYVLVRGEYQPLTADVYNAISAGSIAF